MRMSASRAALGMSLLVSWWFPRVVGAAPPPGARALYPQILCVVPLVGLGTLSDPRRPLFVPVAGEEGASPSKGFAGPAVITAYRSVLSDDGLSAIVLFEARDRAAFQSILSSPRVQERFDLGKTPIEALLPALRVHKKDFELRMLRGGSL